MKAHITAIAAAVVLFTAMPAPAAGGHKAKAKMVTTADGLKYQDLVVGTGAFPKVGQTVTVTYVGTFADGTKFDASADHGGNFSFPLGQHQVIAGWDQGVATMKIGGTRKLIVPPALAYGPNGMPPTIPANATLTFVVQLISAQ